MISADSYNLAFQQLSDISTFNTLPPQQQVSILTAVINYADWRYYVKDDAILSDVEYDGYFKQLLRIEKEHPALKAPDSPTQRVAYGISEKMDTVQHLVPMLSLDNSYNEQDISDWHDRNQKSYDGHITYSIEPKYDGASISIIYDNNLLVRGATRGDGIFGENITANVKMIRNLPLSIPLDQYGLQSIEVRGEVIIPNKAFIEVNEQRAAEGLAILANPRNAASGSLRILDASLVAKRKLSAILYHISDYTLLPGASKPAFLDSHYAMTAWLDKLGFATSLEQMKQASSVDEIIDFCHQFETQRDDLGFEIDGMVIKVDAVAIQESLGFTAHHPRWAMAFKFKARQASAVLQQVHFQVGRTGIITPVAKIAPVYIGGVTVTSVSLFNEEVIKEKDIMIGDRVVVERAGDVIPYIVKSLQEYRDGSQIPIVFPSHCPVCAQAIVKEEGEAAYKCINWSCEAQVVERLIRFASKDAMDIRSLGDANIRRFYELGYLKTIADIYSLPYDKLEGLEKLGKKSIDNLKAAIEKSKNQPLHRIIFGLGIKYVGETTAKTLARTVTDIRDFQHWEVDALLALDDIGPKVANAILDFFKNPKNIALLNTLEAQGVNVKAAVNTAGANSGGNRFEGKTFLFTGTLTQFKRSEAEAQVEALGGKILSGVSSKLHYLIVGEAAGSKLEKAKKMGTITILDETAFLRLMQAPDANID